MEYYRNQVIFPEDFRLPSYNISPFTTESLRELNHIILSEPELDQEQVLQEKFGTFEFLMSAKQAIFKALSFYNLNPDDEVYLVTTTQNSYVSSCVTKQIEAFCKWSREASEKTKLIFVVHEFGTICPDVEQLSRMNLPIIEDFAMSLFSENTDTSRNVSDFKIYSLPKFFPVQFGGILTYNTEKFIDREQLLNEKNFQKDLKKIARHFLLESQSIVEQRKSNYAYYVNTMNGMDVKCRFNLAETETPSVYMFSSDTIDLDGLKVFLQRNGIECSKFYGENSFFLPVHQNLSEFDIDYIVNLINYFVYEN